MRRASALCRTRENEHVRSSRGAAVKPAIAIFVLWFYRSEEHGVEALRVRHHGFRRSAVIHRGSEGSLAYLHDGLDARERATVAVGTAVLTAVAASAAADCPRLMVLLVAVVALAITWLGTIWSGLGIRHYAGGPT